MGYLVASAPFAVAALSLVALQTSAGVAGGLTLAAALLGALLWPELDANAVPGAVADGLTTSARVLSILLAGLLFHHVLSHGGAVERITGFLERVEPDREALALLVVLGVGPFFESVTGFGLAVVIGAPILLAAGFAPLQAAVLACWSQLAVPWGALGVGTTVGADLAGLSFLELSNVSALLNLPLYVVYALATLLLAGGSAAIRRHGVEAVFLGLLSGVTTVLVSAFVAPGLAGALASLLAVAAFLARRARRLAADRPPYRALVPYAMVLVLLIATTGPPAVRERLESLGSLLGGPAPWLFVAALAATALVRLSVRGFASAFSDTLRQWLPVALATLGFVLAGAVSAGSGAAALLAGGAAGALGGAYLALAPLFGALGGGLTGSNVGSNALFMPLQAEAVASTGSSPTLLAGLQNVSGSHASFLAPQRLVLAATATGMAGREAEIVRAAAPPVLVTLAMLAGVGAVGWLW